jgi:hypothetical protein
MKAKTINKIVSKKFEQWLATITDEKVKELVKNNTIMTGGAIASFLLNEPVNDFDFYFRTKEATRSIAEYYVNSFNTTKQVAAAGGITVPISVREEGDRIKIVVKSAGAEAEGREDDYSYFEAAPNPLQNTAGEYVEGLMDISNQLRKNSKCDYRPVFLSSNAITLTGDIQIVIRFYGDPATIHENYDFVHCMNYWTSWDKVVVLNPKALECLMTKELIYIGSKYPIASVCRVRKFLGRGWHITAGQLLKIMMQISKLNLEDFKVLEEQLTGVDVAYFHEILDKMKDKDPTMVDFAYLSTLIDELF